MMRLMSILSRLWRSRSTAAFCAALLAPNSVSSQSLEPSGAVCRAPSTFCGRTVQSSCLSALGVGAIDSDVAALECRNQLETYRDCLSLVASQCGSAAPAGAPEAAPNLGEATAAEPASPTMLAIWREVKDSGDAEALEAFADAYPTSPLSTLARNRAVALRSAATADTPAAPARPTADADAQKKSAEVALARARNREAQAHLARAGYSPGIADGVWGRKSAAALIAFSRANGLPASGALTDSHLAALRTAPDAPPRAPKPPAPRNAVADPSPAPANAAKTATPGEALPQATLAVQVHYKKRLTFLVERCQVPLTGVRGGGYDLSGITFDCLAPIRLSGRISPVGALNSASLTFDGLHDATLSGDANAMEAEFGLIGPRDINRITLRLSE